MFADPEFELLRFAARAQLGAATPEPEFSSLVSGANWHRALYHGRQQGVLDLLCHTLRTSNHLPVCPPEIVTQLRAFSEVNQMRSFARAREVCQVQDLFDRHGIGAALVDRWMIARCCGGNPDAVSLPSVLDYLVPAPDLARVEPLLIAAGHRTEADPEKLIRRGESPIRLNSGLGAHPGVERFWARAGTHELGGRSFRRLGFGDWLLLRVARHPRSDALSLADARAIALLSRRIGASEWPQVFTDAAEFGVAHLLSRRLVASHAALRLPLPVGLAGQVELPAAAIVAEEKRSGDPVERPIVVPYLPTPAPVADRMLALAEITSADVVYDLGCGDGRIAIDAAKRFGARGVGVDLDPAQIAGASRQAALQGMGDRVSFRCGDLFAADVAEATVVTCYLLPDLMGRLQAKLRREARPGTRIVSHDYVFPGWPSEKTEIIRSGPLKISQIYLWRVPGTKPAAG